MPLFILLVKMLMFMCDMLKSTVGDFLMSLYRLDNVYYKAVLNFSLCINCLHLRLDGATHQDV